MSAIDRAAKELQVAMHECDSRKVLGTNEIAAILRKHFAERTLTQKLDALYEAGGKAHERVHAEPAERADITTFVNAQAAEFYEEMLRLCVITGGGQAYEEIKEISTRHMTALADWISNRPAERADQWPKLIESALHSAEACIADGLLSGHGVTDAYGRSVIDEIRKAIRALPRPEEQARG